VVNSERIRAYRRLVGRLAKTDRIDARRIAGYGESGPEAALGTCRGVWLR
jgi:transposase